jgi:outer membrane protein assembly factor BamB
MAGFQKIRTFRNENRSEGSIRGNNRFRLNWIFYLVLAVPGCISIAQQECNWPCFHGADRANKSTETGLLEKWSETGPELIWTISGLGEMGRLAAFDYKTGKEIWNVELRDKFDAEIPEYGYSESVIIDGDRLYCNPGGKKGYTVCLDRKNGNLIWANTEIQEPVGNNSSIIFEHGGYRQIAGVTSKSIYGLDTKTGKLLWFMEYENSRENNIADPIFHDGYIFASSGYGKGSILIKLKVSGSKIIPETVWQTELMDNLHGGVILHDGYLYGSGHNARGWFCLDFMTGKEMWKSDGIGSVTYADGMLYCLDERGIMTLVTATPEKYDAVSTFEVPSGGKGMHWAHPVVCGGRLYIRHTDKLFVYDVKGK